MSKPKIVLLSLLATLAMSALISTTATATTHNFKVEGKELTGAEKEELNIQAEKITFATTIATIKVAIECDELNAPSAANTIEAEGKSKFEFQLKNCYASEIKEEKKVALPACAVAEPFTLKGEGLLKGVVGQPEDELKEKGAEALGTFEITGAKCAIAQKSEVKGHWFQDWVRVWPWRGWEWREFWWQQVWFATLNKEGFYSFAELKADTTSGKQWSME
jgi:hypothetical protein